MKSVNRAMWRIMGAAVLSVVVSNTWANEWDGPYAGVHAGLGFGDQKVSLRGIGAVDSGYVPRSMSTDPAGFIGGVHAGWNFFYSDTDAVYGVEIDFSYADVTGSDKAELDPFNSGVTTTRLRQELDWLGSARLRLGLAGDRWLVFGSAGLAVGKVELIGSLQNDRVAILNDSKSSSETAVGFTLGGGLEYLATNTLRFRVEYLYYDLGNQDFSFGVDPGGDDLARAKAQFDGHVVRVGASYLF